MNTELWQRACALAEQQHSLVSTRQLNALGMSRRAVDHACDCGRLLRYRRGVLKLPGPSSRWQALAAACLALAGEGVASHGSAAALHGIPGFLPHPPHVTVFDRTGPRLRDVRTHRATTLVADDITTVKGIPTTTVARTLVDLASVVGRHRLKAALDEAERLHLVRYAEVSAVLDRIGTSGRSGMHHLRPLLTDRTHVESGLERRWLRRLLRAGVPRPVPQHQLVVDGSVLIIDFAWPDRRVGLEIDGWAPHRVRGAFDNDRRRDLLFRLAGWNVLRATSRTEPSLLVHALTEALSQ